LGKDVHTSLPALIHLNDKQKARVEHVLQEKAGVGVSSFEVDEELVLGFQLSWKAEMIEYSLAQQIREYVKIERQKAWKLSASCL